MTKSRFDHPFRTFTSSGLGETAKTQLWKAGAPRTIDARFPRTLLPILLLLALLAAPVQADQVTSYSQMVARLNRDAVQSPLIRIAALGKSSSGDRTVWMVRLADPSNTSTPRRAFILCRQHGDEPVSTEAALALLDDIASGKRPDIAGELKHAAVYIVPMVNPDGADAQTRNSGDGADLNRDWGMFHEPETRAVYAAFQAIRPQVVLDMHSWDEGDPFRGYCLEAPRAGNPGDALIAQAARDLQQRGAEMLKEKTGQEIAITNYGLDSDPTLCHRFFLEKAGVVSLLFETQPDDAGQSLARRVAVAQSAINWLIADVASDPVWGQIATRTEKHLAAAQTAGGIAPAHLAFIDAAREAETMPRSPLGTAARIVRNAARRIPSPVWWALGVYVLLCAARPIFTPRSGLAESYVEISARRSRKRRRAVSQRIRSGNTASYKSPAASPLTAKSGMIGSEDNADAPVRSA